MMPSVVIVEDNSLLGQTLARFLKNAQYDVLAVFATAEEALVQLPQMTVDLAVVDISLPYTNGLELVSQLNQDASPILCLILSSYSYTSVAKQALAQGAKGYVTKRNPHELLEGIRQVLDGGIYLSKDVR